MRKRKDKQQEKLWHPEKQMGPDDADARLIARWSFFREEENDSSLREDLAVAETRDARLAAMKEHLEQEARRRMTEQCMLTAAEIKWGRRDPSLVPSNISREVNLCLLEYNERLKSMADYVRRRSEMPAERKS
jgi:hypothetical protein